MKTEPNFWEMRILDVLPDSCSELHSLYVGDLYSNGQDIIITGGRQGLYWYTPHNLEKGIIESRGFYHVGLAACDTDNDGIKEIFAAEQDLITNVFRIVRFVPGKHPSMPWAREVVDNQCAGNPHDIVFADIDGDNEMEMVAVAAYVRTPGLFIYKRKQTGKWMRYQIMEGHLTEGIKVADLDGDGKVEIISGPDWYHMPEDGPYSGLWKRMVYAKSFRDMCRIDLVDITGNGRPDIVVVESEYCDGQFSWFENRIVESPEEPFIEHRIDNGFVFAHSIQAVKNEDGSVTVFLAEMAEGGWNQPYNVDARIMLYKTVDRGASWKNQYIYRGQGTHQAVLYDIDHDGDFEIVSKTWKHPIVHIFDKPVKPSIFTTAEHIFIDRDKEHTCTDIFSCDINGDGIEDVVCGRWWYKAPNYDKYPIPGIFQVIGSIDADQDGRIELFATRTKLLFEGGFYDRLCSDIVMVKPIDPEKGLWRITDVAMGDGEWVHGAGLAVINGKAVLACAYHGAASQNCANYPQIFTANDEEATSWSKSLLFDEEYSEELLFADIDGDGIPDIVTGFCWLKNMGNGSFIRHDYVEGWRGARIAVADINGDGLPDIVAGDETVDYKNKVANFGRVVWFENPGNGSTGLWKMHVIDTIRSPHSIAAADIDGDGEIEIIAGEHNPFKPYRSRSRLMVYKKADQSGISWYRYMLDDRFEHHDGTKITTLADGSKGIISHGWADSQFVHLWKFNVKK